MKTRRCVYCKRRRPLKAIQVVENLGRSGTSPWCRNVNTCVFAHWAEVARDMRRHIGEASRVWNGLALVSRVDCRRTIESINESRIRKESM